MPEDAIEPRETVRLSAGDPQRDNLSTGRLVLVVAGEPIDFELTVPAGPVGIEDVLPIFKGLSNLFTEWAVARVEKEGRTISCRAGCGACCRQLVPVSASEAHALAHLVDSMPEPRKSLLRQKFYNALEAFAEGGLLDRLSGSGGDDRYALGMEYFRKGVACPFLEDEACSIHSDRPLACREYLVTSPPQHCKAPTAETIKMVKLDGYPSQALQEAEAKTGWLPLVLALRFDAQAPPSNRDLSAPDTLRDVFGRL